MKQLALFGGGISAAATYKTQRARPPATGVPGPAARPWHAIVLAVDTAERSGWAIRVAGKLLASGEAYTPDESELFEIVEHVHAQALCRAMDIVLVLERAWGRRTNVLIALGQARERWLAAWRRHGLPKARIVSVYPITWRTRVLGPQPRVRRAKGQKVNWDELRARRAEAAAVELAAARAELHTTQIHQDGCTCNDIGPDEAAAILISRWAAHAPDVGRVLPARVRALSTAQSLDAGWRRKR